MSERYFYELIVSTIGASTLQAHNEDLHAELADAAVATCHGRKIFR